MFSDWTYTYQTDIDGFPVHMDIVDSLTMVINADA